MPVIWTFLLTLANYFYSTYSLLTFLEIILLKCLRTQTHRVLFTTPGRYLAQLPCIYMKKTASAIREESLQGKSKFSLAFVRASPKRLHVKHTKQNKHTGHTQRPQQSKLCISSRFFRHAAQQMCAHCSCFLIQTKITVY